MGQVRIYGNVDPRELPTYGLAEAARYLGLSDRTLKVWVHGRRYRDSYAAPIIQLPNPRKPLLSFINLVELHVLKALRLKHNVSLTKVRQAIEYFQCELQSAHPLADERLKTDNFDLFIEQFGNLINISRHGQLAIPKILSAYLHRIEHDRVGLAVRLYPVKADRATERRLIVIDPYVSFGRPTLAGTGVPTGVIAERRQAGDSVKTLSEDYGVPPSKIQEAVRYELRAA